MLNTKKWNKSGDYFTLVILRYIIQMTMLNNFDMDIIDHVELIISTSVTWVRFRLTMRVFKSKGCITQDLTCNRHFMHHLFHRKIFSTFCVLRHYSRFWKYSRGRLYVCGAYYSSGMTN